MARPVTTPIAATKYALLLARGKRIKEIEQEGGWCHNTVYQAIRRTMKRTGAKTVYQFVAQVAVADYKRKQEKAQ